MELFELSMLEVIQKHEYISQREISSEIGISLGMVNILIKKFVKIGLIKSEKLSGNKVRYMLTPQGFSYLSKKTIDYISKSYKAVLKIQQTMIEVLEANYSKDETVFIYGLKDEISEILLNVLREQGYAYKWLEAPLENEKYVQWQSIQDNGIFLLGFPNPSSELDIVKFEKNISEDN
jgi:Predicted transcriptional regulator